MGAMASGFTRSLNSGLSTVKGAAGALGRALTGMDADGLRAAYGGIKATVGRVFGGLTAAANAITTRGQALWQGLAAGLDSTVKKKAWPRSPPVWSAPPRKRPRGRSRRSAACGTACAAHQEHRGRRRRHAGPRRGRGHRPVALLAAVAVERDHFDLDRRTALPVDGRRERFGEAVWAARGAVEGRRRHCSTASVAPEDVRRRPGRGPHPQRHRKCRRISRPYPDLQSRQDDGPGRRAGSPAS